MAFKNGDIVRLKQPVIQGPVTGGTFVEGVPLYEITWLDSDGQQYTRFFPEDVLEAVPTENTQG